MTGILLWLGSGAALGALAAYIQIKNNDFAWTAKDDTHVLVMAAICMSLGPIASMLVIFCYLISKDGP